MTAARITCNACRAPLASIAAPCRCRKVGEPRPAPAPAPAPRILAIAAVLSHVEGWSRDDAVLLVLVALAAGATGVVL